MATAAAKAYLQELARTAGVSADELAVLEKVAENAKFAEEFDKGVKRQSDYSRSMDEVTTLKKQVETQIQSWRDWYATASTNDAAREEELIALRAKVNGTGGGAGGGNGTGGNGNGAGGGAGASGLTEKQIQEREGRMINIIKQMGRISSRHAANFHEELDVDAVEKIAIERGLTVDKAYDEYVAPRVKAAADADVEARIKKAREEGLQEGLTKHEVPGESTRGFHPLFNRKVAEGTQDPAKFSDAQRRDNFSRAYDDAVKK